MVVCFLNVDTQLPADNCALTAVQLGQYVSVLVAK